MTDSHEQLELAQRYAARTLSADDAIAFEDHLVGCSDCQAAVRFAVGLRRTLRETPSASTRRIAWVAGGTALLAAVIATLVVFPAGTRRELIVLGRVTTPPVYAGVSVRSGAGARDSLFAAAMTAYDAGRYEDAIPALRTALSAGADTMPTTFFLASSELMAGRPHDAATSFERVIAGGALASAYLAEAHLYRAHALLQLGRADDALADLAAVDADADQRSAADSLTAQINRVLRR